MNKLDKELEQIASHYGGVIDFKKMTPFDEYRASILLDKKAKKIKRYVKFKYYAERLRTIFHA